MHLRSCLFFAFLLLSSPLFSHTPPAPQAPKVHVFGDSHAWFGFRTIPSCQIHWGVGLRMRTVGVNGMQAVNFRAAGVQENDTAVFVLGEVDIRSHIGRLRDKRKVDADTLLKTMVDKCIATILKNRAMYKKLNIVLMSCVPPSDRINNPNHPYYGKLSDRVNLTKRLNEYLKKAAKDHKFTYLDVYKYYALKDGSLNHSLSDGHVHIHHEKNLAIRIKLNEILAKLYNGKVQI